MTLASWRRCRDDFDLDPDRLPEPTIIERPGLEQRLENYSPLLDIARPEMTNLYQQLAGSGHAIMLTDREGVLLNYIGDPRFTDAAARAGMQTGAVWSEAAQGTNGMGTCLVERKPLVIHKRSHFFTHNARLTCAAAPIFDPHGEILAVLDASSESRMAQQHTMVLLNMSAQVIENRAFFCAMNELFIIRFHSRAEFISTLGEGAIAFDPEGKIVAINRSAMFQIGLQSPGQIVEKTIEQVFSISVSQLLKHAIEHGFHTFPIRDAQHGRRFFASVQPPQNTGSSIQVPLARRQHACIDDNYLRNTDSLHALHFGDSRMKRNIHTMSKILERDIPCLLFGETGTGKEMFARAIHQSSSRRDKPFIAINCASLPESLIESELFGYRPGAFTGANRDGSRGKIVQSDGGTLFLDEIGDMPIHLQARLLRVLEEREVSPLGGEKPIKVSLRVISATHHDIQKQVSTGEFREDLFYRLHGISLTMPPLRERSDKTALIHKISALESDTSLEPEWDPEALKVLEAYSWPGNIRQLRNILRAVTALCENNRIAFYDLPDELRNASTQSQSDGSGPAINALGVAERDALLHELEETHWNITRVAKKLGLSRNTLYRRMKRYEINPPR
ncbi:MAG: sigma-54-dependent Fis family transcriptional regulator [Gammaproteobacteria bacterium]|nr:sigma-54-dependent Fis family transcriptional regulator [Gammaproteobacteria bacterium]